MNQADINRLMLQVFEKQDAYDNAMRDAAENYVSRLQDAFEPFDPQGVKNAMQAYIDDLTGARALLTETKQVRITLQNAIEGSV